MVTKSKSSFEDLPALGEEVDVDWGLDTVHGHVLDVYRGTRPRAVVEIDPGQVGDSSATVTVPIEAVTPSPTAQSPWANHFRYEQNLAKTLKTLGAGAIARVDSPRERADEGVDLVVETTDGRILVIQAKSSQRPLDERGTRAALDRLRRSARAMNGHGLLVTNQPLPSSLRPLHEGDVSTVQWRGSEDDRNLRRELDKLLGTGE